MYVYNALKNTSTVTRDMRHKMNPTFVWLNWLEDGRRVHYDVFPKSTKPCVPPSFETFSPQTLIMLRLTWNFRHPRSSIFQFRRTCCYPPNIFRRPAVVLQSEGAHLCLSQPPSSPPYPGNISPEACSSALETAKSRVLWCLSCGEGVGRSWCLFRSGS